jgi:hypothetical protein
VDVPEQAYVEAMLAVYELNQVELLRDVFVWAYERSCARYSVVRKALGEPDPFRLRHKVEIARLVSETVRACMDKRQATAFIRDAIAKIGYTKEAAKLVEVVETELMSLHEGNIARYRLRPTEYQAWREKWR